MSVFRKYDYVEVEKNAANGIRASFRGIISDIRGEERITIWNSEKGYDTEMHSRNAKLLCRGIENQIGNEIVHILLKSGGELVLQKGQWQLPNGEIAPDSFKIVNGSNILITPNVKNNLKMALNSRIIKFAEFVIIN